MLEDALLDVVEAGVVVVELLLHLIERRLVAATVVAETPHAAHLLESSAAELQRLLAAQGLELTSLQISVGGESAGAAHGGRDQAGSAVPSGRNRGGDLAEQAASAEQTKTIDLGGGVLVDVLA